MEYNLLGNTKGNKSAMKTKSLKTAPPKRVMVCNAPLRGLSWPVRLVREVLGAVDPVSRVVVADATGVLGHRSNQAKKSPKPGLMDR